MRRFAAYDPPEYLDWTPDDAVMAEWRATIEAAGATGPDADAAAGEAEARASERGASPFEQPASASATKAMPRRVLGPVRTSES